MKKHLKHIAGGILAFGFIITGVYAFNQTDVVDSINEADIRLFAKQDIYNKENEKDRLEKEALTKEYNEKIEKIDARIKQRSDAWNYIQGYRDSGKCLIKMIEGGECEIEHLGK